MSDNLRGPSVPYHAPGDYQVMVWASDLATKNVEISTLRADLALARAQLAATQGEVVALRAWVEKLLELLDNEPFVWRWEYVSQTETCGMCRQSWSEGHREACIVPKWMMAICNALAATPRATALAAVVEAAVAWRDHPMSWRTGAAEPLEAAVDALRELDAPTEGSER